jgi:NADPH:quinone reductase-like Zn-dependent oxidoreductase
MKAAVLHTPGNPPRFEDFPEPVPEKDEMIVEVKAAPLNNLSRGRASGSHYDSYRQLPAVCGVDGVGLLEDGTRVYCGNCRSPYGMMAQRTIVPRSWCVPVPDGIDDPIAAALPNAALSSWLPLAFRAQLKPDETVLILGATGVSGKLAIQVARHLGAGRVIAAGRNEQTLKTLYDLGADAVLSLDQPDQELADAFAREARNHHFDIVLDYLWGHPAEVLVTALTGHDVTTEASRIRFVSIGAIAGSTASIPSAALRSSGLELYGSGGGSISRKALFEAFPRMWELAASGRLRIDTEPVPLADVESAWQRQDLHGRRLVIIP